SSVLVECNFSDSTAREIAARLLFANNAASSAVTARTCSPQASHHAGARLVGLLITNSRSVSKVIFVFLLFVTLPPKQLSVASGQPSLAAHLMRSSRWVSVLRETPASITGH